MKITDKKYYICTKKIKNLDPLTLKPVGEGYIKSQLVQIWGNGKNINGRMRYEYCYGWISTHEGYCWEEELRELTKEEQSVFNNKNQTSLPQQFYQSFPD